MRTEGVTGIILTEEKSIRMDKNKTFTEIDSGIMIRTLHNLIKIFCSEVLISTNDPESYSFLNEKLVPDEIKGLGSIGAIISCLKKSSSGKNLVIACDMPMVPAGLLQLLVNMKDCSEFVVPASGTDTIEPLCAIYDKSVIPALEEMISVGDHIIKNLRYYCNTTLVQVHNGNNIFGNMNTSRDLLKKE